MKPYTLSRIAGWSYVAMFFAAMYANFFMLEGLKQSPLETVTAHAFSVRLGIIAFLAIALLDVVIAWALCELYKEHPLSKLSAYFRIVYAAIMAVGVAALPLVFSLSTGEEIMHQVTIFNTIWLIGLFFFGAHLILLGRIVRHIKIIPLFIVAAGVMYMADTSAHFLMEDYESYAPVFLALVAVLSIAGEMAFAVWLLVRGGKDTLLK